MGPKKFKAQWSSPASIGYRPALAQPLKCLPNYSGVGKPK